MKSAATDPEAAAESKVLPLNVAARHHEILNTLALFGHGEMLDYLSESMREVEKAVSDVGKAGEVTIKLKTSPNGGHKRIITFDIKTKKPVLASSNTYVFASQTGQYLENDPDQRELPLKNVTSIDEGKRALRAVGE